MSLRGAVLADDPVAADAGEDVLLAGGSALGAVVAAYLAAAGAHSGVLLSPVTLLLAGAGTGARAFDGRIRQPGLGTKRPRGFKDGEPIPRAARLGVPGAFQAIAVALAYDEDARLGRLARAGIRRASEGGAPARAELLEEFRSRGAGVMTDPGFVRAMLHAGGEAEGGVVTAADFRAAAELDLPAALADAGDGTRWAVAPWAAEAAGAGDPAAQGTGHAVVAIDVRGSLVALSYRRARDGIPVEALELEAPPAAEPVARGVTRTRPGTAIPAPAPIALRLDGSGVPIEVVAAPGAVLPDPGTLASARLRLRWDPATRRAVQVRAPG